MMMGKLPPETCRENNLRNKYTKKTFAPIWHNLQDYTDFLGHKT